MNSKNLLFLCGIGEHVVPSEKEPAECIEAIEDKT